MKRIIFTIIVVIAAIFIWYFYGQNTQKPLPNQPTVTIKDVTFAVEIADDGEERAKGLSNRENLAENAGMLFIFEQPATYSFWMKETLIPLDMIFIHDNRIVTIHRNARPQPNTPNEQLQRYPPSEHVNYVLEINGGLSEKYGFTEGDTVNIQIP